MKSNLFWIIILGSLLIISVIAMFFVRQASGDHARIYKDGELIESVNLFSVPEIYTIPLVDNFDERGMILSGINFIDVDTGRIRMGNADCPNKLCVHQGWMTGGLIPIVCLPNRVVITFTDIDSNPDFDAIVG